MTAGFGRGSVIGWGLGILGLAGFVVLLVISISSRTEGRPSFDSFSISLFFFFVALGLTAGLFVGGLYHLRWLGILGGFFGLFAGYWMGIFAGLGIQYLGWMAMLFDYLAFPAMIGVIVVTLVLSSSLFF